MSVRADSCPNVRNHTKRPDGYVAFMEWAEKKEKTHEQERCPDCGLWVIWRKRVLAARGGDAA
jgi:hypothetical protein